MVCCKCMKAKKAPEKNKVLSSPHPHGAVAQLFGCDVVKSINCVCSRQNNTPTTLLAQKRLHLPAVHCLFPRHPTPTTGGHEAIRFSSRHPHASLLKLQEIVRGLVLTAQTPRAHQSLLLLYFLYCTCHKATQKQKIQNAAH